MVTTTTDTIGNFRRNLALDSEDLDAGAAYTKTNVTTTANNTTAPDGTLADKLADSSGAATGDIRQGVTGTTLTDLTVHTGSVFIKDGDSVSSKIFLQTNGGDINTDVEVTWTAGVPVISATSSNGAGVHTSYVRPYYSGATTGWYRVELQVTYDDSVGGTEEDLKLVVQPASDAVGSQTFIYCWGFQIEERTIASAYQAQGATDDWTGDYTTITAWETARADPIADDKVYVGALLDGAHVYDADVLEMSTADGNTDSTRYRKLTFSTTRYVPHLHTGPKIYIQWVDNASAQEGVRVVEDFFRMEGIGIICENPRDSVGASGVERSGLRVEGTDFLAQGIFVRNAETLDANTATTDELHTCCTVIGTSGFEATDAQFFNCVFMGGRNGHGATYGLYFAAFAEDGGAYNCVAFSCTRAASRGFYSLVASVAVGPEIINCGSFDSHSGVGTDIGGLWSRYGYNVTSDTSAITGVSGGTRYAKGPLGQETTVVGLGGADEFSLPFQAANAQLFRAFAQDIRPKSQSVMFGSGRDETATFTAAGIPVEDYLAAARTSSAWSIGAFDASGTAPGSATEVVELIGSAVEGRHYLTVSDWATATEETSLRTDAEIRIGEMQRDDAASYDLTTSGLRISRTITDGGYYRFLRTSAAWRYNPTEQGGAKIEGEGSADLETLLFVGEEYFRAEGFALEQDYTGANARHLARVVSYAVQFDSLSMRYIAGTAGAGPGGKQTLVVRGSNFLGTNLLALGSGGAAGTRTGYLFEECDNNRLYHSIAQFITGGSGSIGIEDGTRATRSDWSGCIGANCDTDFSAAGTLGAVVDFSISTDATLANLAGCQSSIADSTIWADGDNEDFRLLATSVSLNAGRNLGTRFSADFAGTRRLAPFDIGIFEGVGSAVPLGQAPVLRSDAQNRCRLIEIIRADGTGFHFTDANQPIVHAGRTYVPQDGVNASARRGEANMAESSVEYVGLVSDSSITTADLLAGLFRDAIVIERVVDWRTPWAAPIVTETRWLGPGTFDDETWRGDALGIAHFLAQPIGELMSTTCPVEFGSERCGFDLASETYDNIRVATTLSTNALAFTANATDLVSTADDWFENGVILWLTGQNTNTRSIVKRFDDSTRLIVLQDETGYPISNATDTFQIVKGCRKQYVRDCVTSNDNGVNFQGEPFILGTDDQFETLRV